MIPVPPRAALVYLAEQGNARLCEEVAMLADDALLNQIAVAVKHDAPAAINGGDLGQYAWILDRSAIAAMQPLLAKATLPPELFAVLTEHFGEPGRHSAAVDEIMRGTSSGGELRRKLISENYIYLEDSSPAARVRAFEWLGSQKTGAAGVRSVGFAKTAAAGVGSSVVRRRWPMTQSESGESKKIEKPVKKPRWWRRKSAIVLFVLVGLAVIFRIALVLLLPEVMNKVAGTCKLQCHYDRLDLSLTGGTAAMWGFELLPQEGGDPILRADYLQGDISVLALFRGRLVVYRAAADGVDATFEREADGHIPLLDRFASSGSPAPQPKATPTTNTSAPIDLKPPLRIDALRLEHVRARVRDLSVNPQIDARLALDFRVSNLATPGEPTHFELDFSSDPILDSLLIEGNANGDAKQLTANLHVLMRGLHLKPAQGYLSAIGLRATANDISARATGNLTASVDPNPGDGIKANLTFGDAWLTSDGKEAAALDDLELGVDSLTPGVLKLGKIAIKGVRCDAGRNADGSIAIAGVEIVKAAANAAGPKESSEPVASLASTPPATATPFRWSLDQFTLTGLHVGFLDQAESPPVVLSLDSPGIELGKLDSDHPDSPADFSVMLTAPGIVREIHIAGRATPFAATKSFKLNVAAKGIAPSAAEPYLNAAGLSSEWKDGSFSVSADGDLALADDGGLTANARLSDLRLADDSELFALKEARIQGVGVDPRRRARLRGCDRYFRAEF